MARDLFAAMQQQKTGRDLFASREVSYQPGSMTADEYAEVFGDQPDINGLIAPLTPTPEPSLSDKLLGASEAALTAVTGATGGAVGMIGGTIGGVIDEAASGQFGTYGAANRIQDRSAQGAEALTYAPRSATGQNYVQTLGELGEAAAPLAGLGGQLSAMGSVIQRTAPAAKQVAAPVVQPVKDVTTAIFDYQTPTKQRIAALIENYDPSVETATSRLSRGSSNNKPSNAIMRALNAGGPRIETDKIAIDAINQGFDRGVVAAIKGASPSDKKAMLGMLDVLEKGKENRLFADRNRPTDLIGDRIVDRFDTIRKANSQAGKDVDAAARSLKGKKVNLESIGDDFVSALDDMGIKVGDDMKLDFIGSDIEGLDGPQKIVSTVFNRMKSDSNMDAYDLHRMKKFIDEQVSYGKTTSGMSGRTERMLKGIRNRIDSELDSNFEDYNAANTVYAETRAAMDAFQDVAGRKIDLSSGNANQAVGTLARGLLSNNKSRVALIDALNVMDNVAAKYPDTPALEGPKRGRSNDLMALVMFADELDSQFGPSARSSLQGEVDKTIRRGAEVIKGRGLMDLGVDAAAAAANKMRGINEKNAINAMRKLLSEDYSIGGE